MKMPNAFAVIGYALLAVLASAAGNAGAGDEIRPGAVISFGKYPMTAFGEVLPIEWRVLDEKDGRYLLLSDRGIDAVPFSSENREASWKTSSVRQWLNNDFYNAAFDDSEKARISVTVLENPGNPLYKTPGGEDTEDRIFLLSFDEAERYFSDDAERTLTPTPYAVKNGALTSGKKPGSSFWWLRTPGRSYGYAACIRSGGMRIPVPGCLVNNGRIAVRPALWADL